MTSLEYFKNILLLAATFASGMAVGMLITLALVGK